MTICNMTIEGGGRAGMIAPDETTYRVGRGPSRRRPRTSTAAVERWRALPTDDGAAFDTEVEIDASEISPMVTWGTTPGQVVEVTDAVPEPDASETRRAGARVHGPGARHADAGDQARPRLPRLVHELPDRGPARGRRDSRGPQGRRPRPRRWSCRARPRSRPRPRRRASTRCSGRAGFDWRGAGCSMCLGMNPDILAPGERCASTSNRNFEGRQGKGGRTHLVSPRMAAAAAIEGRFVDIREWS